MAGIVLWNVAEGRPEKVPADQAEALISSGKYREDQPLVTEGEGGETVRNAENAGAADVQGETESHRRQVEATQEAGEAQRRAYVDNAEDKVLTFADGLVDAVSLGFLHAHGATADLRREVNSGSAFAGELAGTALGLKLPGPMKWIAEGGEKVGADAAKALIGDAAEGSRAASLIKAGGGAGEMSALMGAASIGHQATDALLDDKEFSGYAVLEEAGLGAVLGGGFKFLGESFGRAAKKADIQGQGGLLDENSAEFKNVQEAIRTARGSWDGMLEAHEGRLGVLDTLSKEGVLQDYLNEVPEFMDKRKTLARAARAARDKLDALSFEDVADATPEQWKKWHGAVEDYQAKVHALDDAMTMSDLEGTGRTAGPEVGPGKNISEIVGLPNEDIRGMNDLMKNPELRAQYERIYGRSFEDAPLTKPDEAPVAGEENLGGKQTETSGNKTPVQSGKARAFAEEPTPAPAPAPDLQGRFDVSDVDAEMTADAEAKSKAAAVEEGKPWQPSSPAGKFNPAEWTPTTLAGEGAFGGKAVGEDFLGGNGHYVPNGAADMSQNARAFSDFMERAKATPVEAPAARTPVEAPEVRTPVQRRGVAIEPAPEPAAPVGGSNPTPVIDRSASRPTPLTSPMGPKERFRMESMHESEAKRAVRQYIEDWYQERKRLGPSLSPGDHAAGQIRRALDDINATTKGRAVSASGVLGEHLKLPEARSALGATLNDLYTMRRLAEAAQEASTETFAKTGKVAGRTSGGKALNSLMRHMGGRAGAKALGGLVGGPLGYFAGSALVSKYFGFAGRAAGAAGKTYQLFMKAGNALLKGDRALIAARAVAGNRPYTYSVNGPIEDPVQRIEEVQRVAASPQRVAESIARAAGDLAVVHPELVQNAVSAALLRVRYIASMAPILQYDKLGRVIPPSEKDLRRFFEAEQAGNDLNSILVSIQNGSVTRIQAEAFQQAHTPGYHKFAAFLMQDPEGLQALDREKLRIAELVLGAQLTPGSDPNFVARQQVGWTTQEQQQGGGAGPAQALKIPGAGGPPSAAPRRAAQSNALPSQSYGISGRAPGN